MYFIFVLGVAVL